MPGKVLNTSVLSAEKLKATLARLQERLVDKGSLAEVMGETLAAFKKFYTELGDPQFSPSYLETGDTPRSTTYNLNFSQLDQDLDRFYKEVENLAQSQIEAFNYASIVNQELVKRANKLASTVLDLKILSDFTRGDVLIAGDDFRTLDNVDLGAPTASPKAEKMPGQGGMTLKRKDNRNLSLNATIEIFPLAPLAGGDKKKNVGLVNSDPTPGNLERFYEGQYYALIGDARPEGGNGFNIKFRLNPEEGTEINPEEVDPYSNPNAGYFIEQGAGEGQKKSVRSRMFDGDPSTFWESEYVYHVKTPLLGDIFDDARVAGEDARGEDDTGPTDISIVIDYREAERVAKSQDFEGQDLIIELVITFPEQVPVNFVVVDPILFGAAAFPEILDVSTASEDEGQFLTVDGWDASKYAKTITPEANEFLNTVQVGQLLSPSRFEYTGQGVFPFPTRIATKIRIRMKMDNPVPALYERYYILMRNQIDVEAEVTTTVTKGALRF